VRLTTCLQFIKTQFNVQLV